MHIIGVSPVVLDMRDEAWGIRQWYAKNVQIFKSY